MLLQISDYPTNRKSEAFFQISGKAIYQELTRTKALPYRPHSDWLFDGSYAGSLRHPQWPLALLRSRRMLDEELPHHSGGADLTGCAPNDPFRQGLAAWLSVRSKDRALITLLLWVATAKFESQFERFKACVPIGSLELLGYLPAILQAYGLRRI